MLTLFILVSLVYVKFFEGGWITIFVTLGLITLVNLVKFDYNRTSRLMRRLDQMVPVIESSLTDHAPGPPHPVSAPQGATGQSGERTAILLVSGYSGVGLHSLLSVFKLFGQTFRRFVFVQVGVIDADAFKGVEQLQGLQRHAQNEVNKYVSLLRRHGYAAEGIAISGLDVAAEIELFAPELLHRYPQSVFFGGQLVFRSDNILSRWLYNYTVFDIQQRLYQLGIQFVILPIRA